MCGLVGLVARRGGSCEALIRARDTIAHRGPDDFGESWWTYGDYKVGLASRRLAILDLTPAGHMPMCNEDETVWIVYNGEIYNYKELRRELVDRGHRFKSEGDTEVLLHLYEEGRPDFVQRLNGIFAFAIWDTRSGRLMLGRDRFGVKPLYYQSAGTDLWFASEIKALLKFPEVTPEVDLSAVDASLTFLGVHGQATGFKGINKLLPGHCLLWEEGRVELRRYWQPGFAFESGPVDERDQADELRSILGRVVRNQVVSDVPVAAFLSGGLDSASIVAIMAQASSRPVDTYTIVYRQQDQNWERGGSEASYAQEVAQRYGTRHEEIVVEPDVVDLLPKLAWSLDEPVSDPAAISTFLISSAARARATVLLAGQGADEIFAGYHFYSAYRYSEWYRRLPRMLGVPVASGVQSALLHISHVAPGAGAGRVLAVRRFADLIMRNAYLEPGKRHAAFRSCFSSDELHSLYRPEFAAALSEVRGSDYYEALFEELRRQPPLHRQMYVDMQTHLSDLILNYTDKMSMAASAEVRVPFLDNRVVDFAARLQPQLKFRGSRGKYLLRLAMRGIVPNRILSRRKMPFGAPLRGWLRGDLRPMIDDILSESSVRRRGYLNPKVVRRIVSRSRQSVGRSAHQVWALLMLEIWHRVFFDRTLAP